MPKTAIFYTGMQFRLVRLARYLVKAMHHVSYLNPLREDDFLQLNQLNLNLMIPLIFEILCFR